MKFFIVTGRSEIFAAMPKPVGEKFKIFPGPAKEQPRIQDIPGTAQTLSTITG